MTMSMHGAQRMPLFCGLPVSLADSGRGPAFHRVVISLSVRHRRVQGVPYLPLLGIPRPSTKYFDCQMFTLSTRLPTNVSMPQSPGFARTSIAVGCCTWISEVSMVLKAVRAASSLPSRYLCSRKSTRDAVTTCRPLVARTLDDRPPTERGDPITG